MRRRGRDGRSILGVVVWRLDLWMEVKLGLWLEAVA